MSESTSIASIQQLVDAFGGNIALARLLKIEPNSISMWFARGFIPKGWHVDLIVEIKLRGLNVDPELFDLTREKFDVLMARPVEPPPVPSVARGGRSRRVA